MNCDPEINGFTYPNLFFTQRTGTGGAPPRAVDVRQLSLINRAALSIYIISAVFMRSLALSVPYPDHMAVVLPPSYQFPELYTQHVQSLEQVP